MLASSASSPTNGSPSRSETEAVSYKAAAVATVKEYLSSSDLQEVVSSLTELQQPHLAHIFVKQVSVAMIILLSRFFYKTCRMWSGDSLSCSSHT